MRQSFGFVVLTEEKEFFARLCYKFQAGSFLPCRFPSNSFFPSFVTSFFLRSNDSLTDSGPTEELSEETHRFVFAGFFEPSTNL